jgi:outer membrane protein assembly factor BamB
MIARIVRALLCVGSLLLAAHARAGDDWSQWRGPNRDGIAPGVSPPKTWPTELLRAWQVEVGIGHSSPVVAGDRVFVFTRQNEQETVRALKLSDGKELWRHNYPAPYEVSPPAAGHGKGPKSTPLVADGRLYTLGIGGILTCWNAESGEVEWRRNFSQKFKHTSPLYGTAASPLIDNGKLIVHLGGDDQGALMALDAVKGDVEWSWEGDGPGYASPIVAELSSTRQVITLTRTLCVGIDVEDGKLLWKIPYSTEYDQNAVTPVVYEQSVILSGYNKGIDRYRVEHDGDEWRIDDVWENKEVSLYTSSPLLKGERLYGFSHRQKGQLFAIDITTGQLLWTSEGRLADSASLVRTGDVIWAITTQGAAIVFRDSEKQFEQLARYKLSDSPSWAHPVVLAGGLLVKDESKLIRWKLRSTPPVTSAPPDRAELSPSKRG